MTVLQFLAAETSALSAIAKGLDEMIPKVVALLPEGEAHAAVDLQRVDLLHQHLSDVCRTLEQVSNLVGAEPHIELNPLINAVQLDYFKRHLRQEGSSAGMQSHNGDVQLF